jgi:hypothetical protein
MRDMARSIAIRFIGLGLSLVAAASLLLTSFCLLQIWREQGRITTSLQSSLDVITSTLVASSDGLAAINQSLEVTSDSLKSLQDAAQSAGGAFHSQATSLEALSSLFGKDMPEALRDVQASMIGAQVGAKDVEDTLTVLTSNPAFAASPYNPPLLLSTALSSVADGLGVLPVPMEVVAGNILTTSEDLSTLDITVTNFAASLEQLRWKLDDARIVINGYQQELDKLEERVVWLRAGVTKWVRWGVLGISFFLSWMVILQLFTLGRGLRWMMRGK